MYDGIMDNVKNITLDDRFIYRFEIKLIQYYPFAQKNRFIDGFDISKNL